MPADVTVTVDTTSVRDAIDLVDRLNDTAAELERRLTAIERRVGRIREQGFPDGGAG